MSSFIKKEHISIDNKSSEWINIKLPATTWLWKLDTVYLKRIKSSDNKIFWRRSISKGEWSDFSDDILIQSCEEIYKRTIKTIREKKLKRILEK